MCLDLIINKGPSFLLGEHSNSPLTSFYVLSGGMCNNYRVFPSLLSAGLMISGFARAAQILDDVTYLDRAVRAAQFVRSHLYKVETGVLIRNGYRDDSGCVVH